MMRKKLISFFVIVCVIASYITIPASAKKSDDTDTAAAAYALMSDLGIFDYGQSYEAVKNQKVTRGELALFISKMFRLEYSDTIRPFADADSDSDTGRAVLALFSAGILNGYGDGTLRPGEYATLTELATVSLRALGYNFFDNRTSSEYMRRADRLGLLDGVNNAGVISVGDCTVVLYNLLHTNYVYYNGSELQESGTPLEATFGLRCVEGVVTDNAYTSLSGEKTAGVGKVGINYVIYDTETEEVKDMLGYSVVAYVTLKDEKIKFCYYDDSQNSAIDINSRRFAKYNGSYVEYYESEKSTRTSKIKLSPDVAVVKNSTLVETDYKSAFDISYGNFRFVSNNRGDNKYNVVLIDSYENYTVTAVDVAAKVIYTDKTDKDGNRIKFNLDGKTYVDIKMTPYNKPVNENTIEPDDLLCLSVSDDGEVIRGFLCENSVSGQIDELCEDGDESYVVIGGEKHEVTTDCIEKFHLALGMKGKFTFDIFDRIAAFEKDASYTDNIGYLYGLAESGGMENDIKLKIYGLNKKHITAPLADKVKFNGEPITNLQVKTALCTLAQGELKRQPVVFKLNSDGEINYISTAKASKEACADGDTLYTQLEAGSYKWYYIMKNFEGKYPLSKNTYYMRVPASGSDFRDETLFGCQPFGNVTWFNTDTTKNILGLYKFDDDTPYADILLVSNTDGNSLTTQTEITVVSSVTKTLGPDGDAVTAVRGYRRGSEAVAYFPREIYKNDIEEGDIIRFANNVNGLVSDYEVVYDYSLDKVKWDDSTDPSSEEAQQLKYTNSNVRGPKDPLYKFGYVNTLYVAPYSSGLNSVLQIGAVPGETQDTYQTDTMSNSNIRFVVVDSSRRNNKVYMGNFDQMTSYEDSGIIDETSKAFVHTRSGWLIAVIIYK